MRAGSGLSRHEYQTYGRRWVSGTRKFCLNNSLLRYISGNRLYCIKWGGLNILSTCHLPRSSVRVALARGLAHRTTVAECSVTDQQSLRPRQGVWFWAAGLAGGAVMSPGRGPLHRASALRVVVALRHTARPKKSYQALASAQRSLEASADLPLCEELARSGMRRVLQLPSRTQSRGLITPNNLGVTSSTYRTINLLS